ncbi:MAG: glutathione S-transferase family protein [Alphaproteobacteria bacterium]|nr:glutathione S-transferase family protein [Alphaproteobacteria bacterium]
MLKIYGRSDSSNVQKVMWLCAELGLQYEREDVGGKFGKTKEPWYLKLNPNSLIPTIDDDGFVLWESNAILRYLGAKHRSHTMWPAEPKAKAEADRWMDWQVSTAGPAMTPLFMGYVRTPPEKRDTAALEAAAVKAGEVWRILDAHLTDRGYVAGSTFTIGDMPVGIQAYRWFNLPIKRPDLPRLSEWYTKLTKRPAYRQVVMIPMI